MQQRNMVAGLVTATSKPVPFVIHASEARRESFLFSRKILTSQNDNQRETTSIKYRRFNVVAMGITGLCWKDRESGFLPEVLSKISWRSMR
jgi:hypothetical protein